MEKIHKGLCFICDKFSYVSIVATFFLMVLTAAQVLLRNFTSLSIRGNIELTETGLILIVFCSIAYLQTHNGHIRVDLFINKLPERAKHFVNFIGMLFGTVIVSIMFYASLTQVESIRNFGQRTTNLLIPLWPFVAVMCAGMLLYALTLLFGAVIELKALCLKVGAKENQIRPQNGHNNSDS